MSWAMVGASVATEGFAGSATFALRAVRRDRDTRGDERVPALAVGGDGCFELRTRLLRAFLVRVLARFGLRTVFAVSLSGWLVRSCFARRNAFFARFSSFFALFASSFAARRACFAWVARWTAACSADFNAADACWLVPEGRCLGMVGEP